MPTFGRIAETENFLNSISKSINKKYLVILVDDHPEKVTFSSFKQNQKLKILTSKKELWWVGSINYAVKTLFQKYNLEESDVVIFANSDVCIEENTFTIMFNEIKKNNNQIIHPRTFNEEGVEVSSGSKIISFFPYITKHPKNLQNDKEFVHMGTARFLMMSGKVLNKVGYVNNNLLQYGGDNDFTLTAKRFHDINTYILKNALCRLDDSQTGIKNHTIKSVRELFNSFSSIKSPNNIKYRYILFEKFFGKIMGILITFSMTINTIIKFILKKYIKK